MDKVKISLNSLVKGCENFKFEKRIVIIPNCSEDYKNLTGELNRRNFSYVVDDGRSSLHPRKDCYVIDFRKFNFVNNLVK